jgi:hypothetical protein
MLKRDYPIIGDMLVETTDTVGGFVDARPARTSRRALE